MHAGRHHHQGVLLMDRVVRVRVLGRRGYSVPGAHIRIYVNGKLLTEAMAGAERAGTLFTIQVSDPAAPLSLEALCGTESQGPVNLAPAQDAWTFQFKNVEDYVPDKPFWEEHLTAIIGGVCLAIALIMAVAYPTPAPFQQRVFLGTLSLGLAGLGSEIPGFLNVNLTLGQKAAITAGGALAIFVIAFFFDPGGALGH
jgi:hypothetical protein